MNRTFEAPSPDGATVLGLLKGVAVFRGLALVWALIGMIPSADKLTNPALASVLMGAMIAWTALATVWLLLGRYSLLLSPVAIGPELAIGLAAMVGDGFVYEADRSVSLAWAWPAAAVITIGIARGWTFGVLAAAVILAGSFVAESQLGKPMSPIFAFSRTGLWAVTGILAGFVSSRLRKAETEVALARAREEVARSLHDGVLQTLAVIQRRSDDRELAALAREQEAELRTFLSGGGKEELAGLEPELRRQVQRFLREHRGVRTDVVVAPDAPEPAPDSLAALSGAVREALTNVAKHAEATSVIIYAEPADEDDLLGLAGIGTVRPTVFVSIKDDGVGFKPSEMTERMGLSRSIRGRIEQVGGVVDVIGRPGRGVEVKLWV